MQASKIEFITSASVFFQPLPAEQIHQLQKRAVLYFVLRRNETMVNQFYALKGQKVSGPDSSENHYFRDSRPSRAHGDFGAFRAGAMISLKAIRFITEEK
jgi:hypothetical protein